MTASVLSATERHDVKRPDFKKLFQKKDLMLFLIASALLGVAAAVDSSTMSNKLYEGLQGNLIQRSLLEIPRELPGLMIIFVFALINSFSDRRVAGIANIIAGIGMLAFGNLAYQFGPMIVTLILYSLGMHMYFPLASSLAMSFASKGKLGRRMGQVQGVNSAALIISAALLYVLFQFARMSYEAAFTAGAVCLVLAGVLFLMMSPIKTRKGMKRFVWRKEYKLYYALSVVNGARQQLTITFAPWLLIDVFKQPVTTLTLLFFIISAINVFFKPLLGHLIDKLGERFVLMSEAVLLFVLCFGYAFAKYMFDDLTALIITASCYVLDTVIMSVSMARATYIKKIAVDPMDVTPTLTTGLSLTHLLSLSIPILAGFIWYSSGASGYIYIFMGGAAISIANFFLAVRVKVPRLHIPESEAESLPYEEPVKQ
jgi:MFS family permease